MHPRNRSVASRGMAGLMMQQVVELAQRQFETAEFRQLLGTQLTMARARFFAMHMAHYVRNRWDCWGHVQGAAPLPIKRLIWQHEQEELVNDPRVGMDHYALTVKEAQVLNLSAQDIERGELCPGAVAAFYAWTLLAKNRPWREAFASSAILEIRNSGAVVAEGGISYRIREKMVAELGLPREKLINQSAHVEADAEHGTMLEQTVPEFVRTPEDEAAVLRGARESLIIDRAFRGALAAGMQLIQDQQEKL